MSWWWTAPLAVTAAGAALLAVVARRGGIEAGRAERSAEDLRATVAQLQAARRDLVIDVTRFDPDGDLVPEPSEKGPVPQ